MKKPVRKKATKWSYRRVYFIVKMVCIGDRLDHKENSYEKERMKRKSW